MTDTSGGMNTRLGKAVLGGIYITVHTHKSSGIQGLDGQTELPIALTYDILITPDPFTEDLLPRIPISSSA